VNGQPGILARYGRGRRAVLTVVIEHGRITSVYMPLNPDELRRMEPDERVP
jgi:hypothetical protein